MRRYYRYLMAIWLIPDQQVHASVMIMAHWVLTRTRVVINMILSTHERYIAHAIVPMWYIGNPSWAAVRNGVHPGEFVFQKPRAIASDFCGIQTHNGKLSSTRLPTIDSISSTPFWFFFFVPVMTSQKHQKSLKSPEIKVRGQKSQLSIMEKNILRNIHYPGFFNTTTYTSALKLREVKAPINNQLYMHLTSIWILVVLGWDDGFSQIRHQTIPWTNALMLPIRPAGAKFNNIWFEIL